MRRMVLTVLLAGVSFALSGCATSVPALSDGTPKGAIRYGILPATGYSYDQNGNPIPSDYHAPGAPGGLYNPYR